MSKRSTLVNLFPMLLVGFLVSTAASTVNADWRRLKSEDFTIANPPPRGSQVEIADIEELLRQQKTRDFRICEWAVEHGEYSYEAIYAGTLSPREIARTKPLLNAVFNVNKNVVDDYKEHFDRLRPYKVDKRIKPCVTLPNPNASYPSGHAAFGALSACVLSKIYPERAEELSQFGHLVGDNRVTIGIHYPSDVVAGKRLGNAICRRLMSDEDFIRKLDALK